MTRSDRKRDPYKWVILTLSFLLMVTFAISLQALPPILDSIGRDIPFSNSQAGTLMGVYALPGIFLPFLVAFLAQRFDLKKLLLLALAIMIIGLIGFSWSKTFSLLILYRLLAGVGGTVLVVLAPLLVTMFFDKKEIGTAMGIFNTAVPVGTVIAANFFGYAGQWMDWRVLIRGISVFAGIILVGVFFVLSIPKKDEEKQSDGPKEAFKMNSGLWILAITWAVINGQLVAYVTFGPQFFQSVGMASQIGGFLSSIIMFVPIFLAPLCGVIIDKTGQKKKMLLLGSIIMAIAFVLLATSRFGIPLWAALLGVGFSPMPVLVFSSLPEMIQPHQMGMGLGLLTVASNLGMTVAPAGLGGLLDRTSGSFLIGFLVLATFSIMVIFLSFRLEIKNSN